MKNGKRAILYTFEESVESILIRSRGVGMAVDPILKAEILKIVQINPMELYPDEFLAFVRKSVGEEKYKIVMIDGMRGYSLAMEQFGSLVAYLKNLVTYLHNQEASAFLINEVEQFIGPLVLTEMGISYIGDNIILLRYAEVDGKVIRVIDCVKKRLGNFQPELREMLITSSGLKVGKKLEGLRGVLTGVPEIQGKIKTKI